MTKPLIVDLPHNLGAEEAKRRLRAGIGNLTDQLPGGAQVESGWDGDRMNLSVQALGQSVDSRNDVGERLVRFEVVLPGILGMFAGKVEGLLRKNGSVLLEDKSDKR